MLVSTYESAWCHNLDEHHHPHPWENSDVTWVKEFLFHVVTWIVYFWVTVGRARRPLSSIPSTRSLCTRGRHDVRFSSLIRLSCLFIDLYEKLILKLCWHYTTLSWVIVIPRNRDIFVVVLHSSSQSFGHPWTKVATALRPCTQHVLLHDFHVVLFGVSNFCVRFRKCFLCPVTWNCISFGLEWQTLQVMWS
jgi:hypothetical protein